MKQNNVIYAIGDEPYCLWESDIDEARASFLKAIDHEYFECVVRRSEPDLEDPELSMRAAAGMRLALFHGSETMFLLMGALLQGERCPHAWVGSCSTGELRLVLDRIGSGGDLLLLNRRIRRLSWLDISREVLPFRGLPDVDAAVKSFAKLWELLALNHTDQNYIDEYNSLKHGFRVAHGGFQVDIGQTGGSGPFASNGMVSLGSSKWGSAFRVIRKFDAEQKGGRSRKSVESAVNWDAKAVAASLKLVSASIGNIVSRLQTYDGVRANFTIPDACDFEPAYVRISLLSMGLQRTLYADATTKDQLLKQLKKNMARRLADSLRRIILSRAVPLSE
ncbi:hypothetical protein ACSFA0_07620 [Variovorax sp. LT1P1]|uniref:hypothetical protein n=1 Tax=Variovorax sp. LT1P1 TaxID=3443730 RepID=UPI003F459430